MPLDNTLLQRLRENDETLSHLNLEFQQLSDADVKALSFSLASNSILVSLGLQHNRIGDKGAKYLGQALAKNFSLKLLKLRGNQIGALGAEKLAQALTRNSSLKSLNLENNKIDDVGARALIQALKNNATLKELDIGTNQIKDAGLQGLAQVFAINSSLTFLCLWNNQIKEAGGEELVQAFASNSTLTSVFLNNNSMSVSLHGKIQSLTSHNRRQLYELQISAYEQLKVGRVLLYKAKVADSGRSLFLELPLEIKERIVMHTSSNASMTNEQQRLILNYAEGKVEPVADLLNFFRVTQCDKVMKTFKNNSKINEPLSKKIRMS